MTKRSVMLKVVAIIMIVIGAIMIIFTLGSYAAVSSALSYLGGSWSDLNSIMEQAGMSYTGPLQMYFIFAIAASIFELFAGIVGLAVKKKGFIFAIGIISVVLELASVILAVVTSAFSPLSLLSFVLPVLYVIGAKLCIQ